VNHLAYLRRGAASFLTAGALALAAVGAFGCQAGVKMSVTGSGGSSVGQGGSGATGGSGTGGRVVITGNGGGGGDVSMGTGGMISPDGGCMSAQLTYTPTQPTVFILVDRSGSEFDSGCPNVMTGTYFKLRSAVETVVSQLQATVRFGLGVFVGDHSTGTCALDWDTVPIALNNSDAIKSKYDSLGQVAMSSGGNCKADTPATEAIPMVKAALNADAQTNTGPKYVLFATDGETDFCDDNNALCPADAVTYQIQDLYAAGFGTLVIGTASNLNAIDTTVLQNFANAGAGQGIIIPPGSGAAMLSDFWYQCNGMTNGGADSWSSLYSAAGRTGMTSLATYSSTAGTAPVFAPTSVDTASIVTQISAALNTIPRSCVFDLSALGNPIKVDRTKLNEGGVFLNGASIPLDPNNMDGWDMVSDTQLELFGSACMTFQTPGATENINLEFPCDIIITIDKP
jgi:hypothetical protein